MLISDLSLDFMPPVWFLCITSFNHWLLIVNASFNFLIYCSIGTGFKEAIAGVYADFTQACCSHSFPGVSQDHTNGGSDCRRQPGATSTVEMSRMETILDEPGNHSLILQEDGKEADDGEGDSDAKANGGFADKALL